MVKTPAPGPVERYLAGLRRELRGPYFHRRSMLREIRDGLDDAVRGHLDTGASRPDAERQAVAEFGPVRVVAAEIRVELAAACGRYLAALVVIFGAAQFALAHHTWQTAAAAQHWPAPTPEYATLAHVVDVSNVVLAAAAALAVLLLGRGARLLPTARVVRVVAVATLAGVVAHVVSGVVLTMFAPRSPATWDGPELALMALLSMVSTVWISWLAWRCLWLTSPRRLDDGADDGGDLAPRLPLCG